MITYLSTIINLLDTLGNKKTEVIKYILKNMDKSNNVLNITTRELAVKSKVSKPIVIETLQSLEKAGIIKRRVGAIMVSSKLIHRGDENKEKMLIAKFKKFAN